MTVSSVSIPVVADNIVEEDERFNVMLRIPSSDGRRILAGSRNSAVVIIKDSNSK